MRKQRASERFRETEEIEEEDDRFSKKRARPAPSKAVAMKPKKRILAESEEQDDSFVSLVFH